MNRENEITKVLAIIGLVLVWFTILAPLVLAIISLVSGGGFRLDYLMPAELFIVALVGGLSLIWAALRSRLYMKWIQWAFGIAFITLLGGATLAEVTGLAAGISGSEGWLPVAIGLIIAYDLALIALGVGGWYLCRDFIGKEQPKK
jgi:hypothetical protein